MGERVVVRLIAAVVAAFAVAATVAVSSARAACDPLTTTPVYAHDIPTVKEVTGIRLGAHKLSYAEMSAYIAAVDAASPRVVSGTYGTTWRGRKLRYVLVSRPENLAAPALSAISHDAQALRNPQLDPGEAAAIEARLPAILGVGASVHGNEPSGTDATLRTLYELASRDDCAATQVLDNALVLLTPMQNPDGHEANFRRNAYWFDLNRDDWARTQPETDGRIELFRRFPPLLFDDEHENGSSSYFFPPTTDPVYHEVPDSALHWIDDIYGPALAQAFAHMGFSYYTGSESGYDFFAPEYGDTVVADGFLGAGMTFEKGYRDTYSVRVRQHWVSQWVSLAAGATRRQTMLEQWHAGYVRASQEGEAGTLEPNVLEDQSHPLYQQVPDIRVRSYFLLDQPNTHRELMQLVRRLQRMDVRVYRTDAAVQVPDFRAYGRDPEAATIPAGSVWVPMAQGQKHWIQAMLNQDTYIATAYWYDTTAWSQPLLLNVPGGSSGAVLAPASHLLAPVGQPGPMTAGSSPRVAVYRMDNGIGVISDGWLRWVLDHDWRYQYSPVTAQDIRDGALGGYDALLVPDGKSQIALRDLGATGARELRRFVDGGGRYIGWYSGVRLAVRLGLTDVRIHWPSALVPGSIYRVLVNPATTVGRGIGETSYVFNTGDPTLQPSDPSQVPVAYPNWGGRNWYRSGFARHDHLYAGTALVVDQPVGQGHVISFATEPDFRGYTGSTMRMLWNAMTAPEPAASSPTTAMLAGSASLAAARAAEAALPALRTVARIDVTASRAAALRSFLAGRGLRFTERAVDGDAVFAVAPPAGASADWARGLGAALARSGIRVAGFAAPLR
jgi:hypothetical protein